MYSDLAEQWEANASEGAATANGAHAFNRTRREPSSKPRLRLVLSVLLSALSGRSLCFQSG
jgi:hypothetical protein